MKKNCPYQWKYPNCKYDKNSKYYNRAISCNGERWTGVIPPCEKKMKQSNECKGDE